MQAGFHLEDNREINGRRQAMLLMLAAAFVFSNAVTLSMAREGIITWSHMSGPCIWLLAMGVTHLALHRTRPERDPFLLPLLGFLTGWGLVSLDRLAPNFLSRQLIWLGLGIILFIGIAVVPGDLRWLRRYRYTWLTAGLLLLATTLVFGVNPSGFGATLWLPVPFLGGVYFQPSELLKLLLVIFLASYFDERQSLLQFSRGRGRFGALPYLAPTLLMWGFCLILLVWQKDLGAATLFFVLFLALLYLATGDLRTIAGGLLLLALGSVFAYYAFDVVALRVEAWWNPWPDAADRAYQIVQSLYALASGGVSGQGVGQGFPEYIPVVHSDFVFAAIAEEWGLMGTIGIVACFALLAQRGLRIASKASRPFRLYLAAGISVVFSAQALFIMAGVVKLMPLTGVTLPFVSYGGSSLLISMVMAGLLMHLSGDEA